MLALWLLNDLPVFSQGCPTYTAFSSVLQGTAQVTPGGTISFPATGKAGVQSLREKNKSARLYFRLDLGDHYIRDNSSTWKFEAVVDVSYGFATAGTLPAVKTLTITERAPEMLKIEDVMGAFTAGSPAFGATVNIVSVTDGTNTLSGPGLLQDYLFNNLRLKIELAREYEVDVRTAGTAKMSNAPLIFPATISNRLVTFSWQPNASGDYGNYELQVLKLYNTDPALEKDLNQISSVLDWSRALTVETQSCRKSISLTMGEGSGYYIWRVRPIGNYFPGGISNAENYGEWSLAGSPTATSIALNKVSLAPTSPSWPYAFHFQDPDEHLNWIYNRVFTEGDTYDKNDPTGLKSSEGMSYADGLMRTRQSQKYNSSENTNIVSQTIHDYAGRPALATVPVPVSGHLNGYKRALVQNTVSGLYTARNFDDEANIQDPEPVKDAGTPYSYYSQNPSLGSTGIDNAHVPSAEGFPFKRTIYKNDGTNRVEEESGVGKTHAIGQQSNGRGRTMRIFYSTPSDDELIRIFGDEAPLSKSVIKTTTIDQNEVISISYTSKEGKTIATSLSSASVTNLSPLGALSSTYSVRNSVDENIQQGNVPGRTVASKRISVMTPTAALDLHHTTARLPGDNPGCIDASCNYRLRIYLKDVQNNITYVSDADVTSPGVQEFVTTTGSSLCFTCTSWNFQDVAGQAPDINPGGGDNNQIVLNAGEYVFVKELYSGNAPGYGEMLGNADNEKTRPIYEALADQMRGIDNPAKKVQFDSWMSIFRDKVEAYNLAPSSLLSEELLDHLAIDKNQLPSGYQFPLAPDFSLTAVSSNTADPGMDNLQISTSCCGVLGTQVPKTTICVLCDGNPDAVYQPTMSIATMTAANAAALSSEMTPYGMNDFKTNLAWDGMSPQGKREAIHDLVERELINLLKEKMDEEEIPHTDLYKLAPGFSFESLNFMLSNMLISQYYTGSIIEDAGSWYEAVMTSAGSYSLGNLVMESSPNYPYNYDCKLISDAWQVAMAPINMFESEDGGGNALKEYDKAEGPGAALLEALNVENWNPNLRDIIKQTVSVIGKLFNKLKNSKEGAVDKDKMESLLCVPAVFMQVAGYQFAAIIDGDPLPPYINTIPGQVYPDEFFSFTHPSTPSPAIIYTNIFTDGGSTEHQHVPLLFTVEGGVEQLSTMTCNGLEIHQLYYPYVIRPEWMFKYYVYNVFENGLPSPQATDYISDGNTLLPHQVMLDVNYNYNVPFSYLSSGMSATLMPADLCYQPLTSTYETSGGGSWNNLSYTHLNWSSAERYTFYDRIRGAGICAETKGVSIADEYYHMNIPPACTPKDELYAIANKTLDDYITGCADLAPMIRQALLNELEAACYTVVACVSSPPVTGEVTMKQVERMVEAVIAQSVAQLQQIQSNFNSPSPPFASCSSGPGISQMYSHDECDLPACVQTDCREIVFYEDNTIGLVNSRKMEIRLFSDCDQKILDMFDLGTFLPYIPPINGCTNNKDWHACSGTDHCDDYGEKTGCPASEFERYSKEYNVSATSH